MRLLPDSQKIAMHFPGAPRWYRLLLRCRFLLAGIYLLSCAAAVVFMLLSAVSDLRNFAELAVVTAVLFAGQAMLLLGAPHFRRSRPVRTRHKMVSLGVGALAAAVLSFGFLATILSLYGHNSAWLVEEHERLTDPRWFWLIFLGVPWIFWLAAFTVLWAGRWTEGYGKMYRLLVAGTFAEILFTVPVDVMVRKRTSCYCDEGTFWALIAGATTAVWTFGPGVALLFLAVRFRGKQLKGICVKCGYDLRGLPENRCPECGTPFVIAG